MGLLFISSTHYETRRWGGGGWLGLVTHIRGRRRLRQGGEIGSTRFQVHPESQGAPEKVVSRVVGGCLPRGDAVLLRLPATSGSLRHLMPISGSFRVSPGHGKHQKLGMVGMKCELIGGFTLKTGKIWNGQGHGQGLRLKDHLLLLARTVERRSRRIPRWGESKVRLGLNLTVVSPQTPRCIPCSRISATTLSRVCVERQFIAQRVPSPRASCTNPGNLSCKSSRPASISAPTRVTRSKSCSKRKSRTAPTMNNNY